MLLYVVFNVKNHLWLTRTPRVNPQKTKHIAPDPSFQATREQTLSTGVNLPLCFSKPSLAEWYVCVHNSLEGNRKVEPNKQGIYIPMQFAVYLPPVRPKLANQLQPRRFPPPRLYKKVTTTFFPARRVSPLVWLTYHWVTVFFWLIPNFSTLLLNMPLTKVCETCVSSRIQLTRSQPGKRSSTPIMFVRNVRKVK